MSSCMCTGACHRTGRCSAVDDSFKTPSLSEGIESDREIIQELISIVSMLCVLLEATCEFDTLPHLLRMKLTARLSALAAKV